MMQLTLAQVMKEARQKGLRCYIDKKGIPHAYRRHIDKLCKAAADSAVGLAEALRVLNEDEEDTDPSEVSRVLSVRAS